MKKILIILVALIFSLSFVTKTLALSDTQNAINNGINYLGTQLNGATGQIQGGSTGDASPWAAIAFSANGIDPSTVKSSDNAPSLVDYLRNNPPTSSSSATDWEKWILAIVASGKDPTNFGGINYINSLESSYYASNQIENNPGDTTDEASDWFGLMALIASKVDKTDPVLTNTLSFILSNQDCDGGFGYAVGAGSDGNDTAAAIQALVDAKIYGVDNPSLDNAIANAKSYLLTTQDSSTGGFLYDTNPWTTSPDTDSTTWAIMALNALGMQNSNQANIAKTWLITLPQESQANGGFTACNSWDPTTFACTGVGSNSTTTSHALIGLSGKGWVSNVSYGSLDLPEAIVLCSVTPTPTDVVPSATPTVTPTPTTDSGSLTDTPTPTPSSSSDSSSSPTPTPTPTTDSGSSIPTTSPLTPTPEFFATTQSNDNAISPTTSEQNSPSTIPTPKITQEVLGTSTNSTNTSILSVIFIVLGILSLGTFSFQIWKKN